MTVDHIKAELGSEKFTKKHGVPCCLIINLN